MKTLSCPPPRAASAATSRATRVAALVGVGALAGLLLVACGGDTDAPVTPPVAATEVPTSAAASTAALEAFAISLPQTENTEPLLLDNISSFPTSETEDPIVLQ